MDTIPIQLGPLADQAPPAPVMLAGAADAAAFADFLLGFMAQQGRPHPNAPEPTSTDAAVESLPNTAAAMLLAPELLRQASMLSESSGLAGLASLPDVSQAEREPSRTSSRRPLPAGLGRELPLRLTDILASPSLTPNASRSGAGDNLQPPRGFASADSANRLLALVSAPSAQFSGRTIPALFTQPAARQADVAALVASIALTSTSQPARFPAPASLPVSPERESPAVAPAPAAPPAMAVGTSQPPTPGQSGTQSARLNLAMGPADIAQGAAIATEEPFEPVRLQPDQQPRLAAPSPENPHGEPRIQQPPAPTVSEAVGASSSAEVLPPAPSGETRSGAPIASFAKVAPANTGFAPASSSEDSAAATPGNFTPTMLDGLSSHSPVTQTPVAAVSAAPDESALPADRGAPAAQAAGPHRAPAPAASANETPAVARPTTDLGADRSADAPPHYPPGQALDQSVAAGTQAHHASGVAYRPASAGQWASAGPEQPAEPSPPRDVDATQRSPRGDEVHPVAQAPGEAAVAAPGTRAAATEAAPMAQLSTTASEIKVAQTVNVVPHPSADANEAPIVGSVAAAGDVSADPSRAGANVETQSVAPPVEPTLAAPSEGELERLAGQSQPPRLNIAGASQPEMPMPGGFRTYAPAQGALRGAATATAQPTAEGPSWLQPEDDAAPAFGVPVTSVQNHSRAEAASRAQSLPQQSSPAGEKGVSGDPPTGERTDNIASPQVLAGTQPSPSLALTPAARGENSMSDEAPARQRITAPVVDKPEPSLTPMTGSENAQSRSAPGPAGSDGVEPMLAQDASTRPPESHSSSQPLPTGTRNEPSATQAVASHADLADQPQDPGLGRPRQAHAAEAQPEPQPKSQPQLQPDRQPHSQPQPQTESQPLTQDAHSAREIARPDAGPIAPNIEGHAPREAAHLSSPQIPNQVEIIEQIARAARAQFHSGHTELALRLDPPTLGTVHLRVVSQGAAVTAQLEASAAASRDLINANLPALKEALAGVGIDISHFSVTVGGGARQDMANGAPPHSPGIAPGATAPNQEASEPDAAAIAALRAWAGVGGRYFDAFA